MERRGLQLRAVVTGTVACTRCGSFEQLINGNGKKAARCAPCQEYVRRWRLAHAEQTRQAQLKYRTAHADELRERARLWRLANGPVYLERARQQHAANPEPHRRATKRWYAAHPEYQRLKRDPQITHAYNVVKYALSKGRLVRPPACEQCGRVCKPQAAHRDYARPFDLRWLCLSCHSRWDHAEPKSAHSRSRREAPE
jgi:hypothetical protein